MENYQVEVTNNQGCSSISEPFMVSTVGIKGVSHSGRVQVFPNPFSAQTTITFPNSEQQELTFQLIDLSGKILRKVKIASEELILYREDLANRLYFFELKGKKIFVGKLIVE